jgi:hypothetical protein
MARSVDRANARMNADMQKVCSRLCLCGWLAVLIVPMRTCKRCADVCVCVWMAHCVDPDASTLLTANCWSESDDMNFSTVEGSLDPAHTGEYDELYTALEMSAK